MTKLFAGFCGTALALVVLDALWLAFMGPKIYRPIIGEILADKVSMAPAVTFYILYVIGVTVLAVRPAIAALFRMDAHGVAEDAQDVGEIVRSVRSVGGMRQQSRRERFEWREGPRGDWHIDSFSPVRRETID